MRKLIESYNNGYGPGNGGNGNGAPGSGNNGGNGNNSNGGNGNGSPKRPSILMLILSGLMTVIVVLMLYNAFFGTNTGTEVSYTDFLKDLEADKVAAVEVNKESGMVTVQLKQEAAATPAPGSYVSFYGITQKVTQSQTVYYTMLMEDLDTLTARLQEHDVQGNRVTSNTSNFLMEILVTVVLPVVLIWIVAGFLFRRMGGSGGPMGVGKSNAKVYVQKETGVTFKDVAGEDEEKEELKEVVEFLKSPDKFNSLGARIPHGVLLVGPPGTGKTLLARACAGEAGVPFYSISGSDFVEMYVGVGASRVRDLFDKAKKTMPCIIFIDEIDAVGRQRGAGLGGGHDEREQTLNQLLVEMDGFEANDGVIVMAATNRADILDKALLRPGRFDRQVYVGLPDVKGREEILRVHTKNKPLGPDVSLKTIARSTAGFSGADLENLVNEAALLAARQGKKAITEKEIEEASVKVMMGPEKKSHVVTDEERRLTAYHETGHAITGYFSKHHDPVHQISIISRGGAGGYTMYLPEKDPSYVTKTAMFENIVTLLGGRVAEQLVLEDISTGASNDLQQATNIARQMITKYGFSERLGPVVYGTSQEETFLGRDLGQGKGYSETTAAEIDSEMRDIIDEAYETCRRTLTEHIDQLHALAQALMEREKLNEKEFNAVMAGETLPQREDPDAKPAEAQPAVQPVEQAETAEAAEPAEPAEAVDAAPQEAPAPETPDEGEANQ